MDSITVFPQNEKQQLLLTSLLTELKIRFEIGAQSDDSRLTEREFYAPIDRSLQQAEVGQAKVLSPEEQKVFLGL